MWLLLFHWFWRIVTKPGMVPITTLLFLHIVDLALLEEKQIFKASLHPLFNVLVAAKLVVSASVRLTVLLRSVSLLAFAISTSSGLLWRPSYFPLQKKIFGRKYCPADLFLSVSEGEGERKRWTQFSKFPCFAQQGGSHVLGHSKKRDFHRAPGSSQISQHGMNPWPLLRLQNCS